MFSFSLGDGEEDYIITSCKEEIKVWVSIFLNQKSQRKFCESETRVYLLLHGGNKLKISSAQLDQCIIITKN